MSRESMLIRAEDLSFAYPGVPLFAGLGFSIGPGLTLVRGGDGRGKSTLLNLLAGRQTGSRGRLLRDAGLGRGDAGVFLLDPRSLSELPLTGAQWLQSQAAVFAAWDATSLAYAQEGFRLTEHLGKSLHMLSTGVLRKLWLSAALASGAGLTLLETPWAGLDMPSRAFLDGLLRSAAAQGHRAWVVADHEFSAHWPALARAQIDLGD